ncbi:hypothetical protein AMTR_s00080p00025640, partial [Amborella trichopoda]
YLFINMHNMQTMLHLVAHATKDRDVDNLLGDQTTEKVCTWRGWDEVKQREKMKEERNGEEVRETPPKSGEALPFGGSLFTFSCAGLGFIIDLDFVECERSH